MSSEKKEGSLSQFAKIEQEIQAKWEAEGTFAKSIANREGQPHFEFYDGPPFANGLPHFGHSLVTSIKDAVLRYKTMRGLQVPRRNGWDCHGLPVEFAIEKEFKVSGKKQIMELGLEKFNVACRESIFRYKADWEGFMQRIGRWSDYENYYATVDTSYTESVWWILSEINKKDLLYRGLKSVPYCPRCETPLSNFELNEGYKDNVPDPSVFVLFPLIDENEANKSWSDGVQGADGQRTELYNNGTTKEQPQTATPQSAESDGRVSGLARKQADTDQVYLVAWTTTPWTLPANAALAVDPEAEYAYAKLKSGGSTLILAKNRLSELSDRKADYSVLKTLKGQELVGRRYEPLYSLPQGKFSGDEAANAHQVYADDNVSLEDGTGILHVAPRYGETDLNLGLKEKLPLIESVDGSGHMVYPGSVAGQFFKEADSHIIAELTKDDRVFAAETKEHTYPFCWRCDTPLMYFATATWFVAVSKVREDMLKTAQDISWVPGHIKDGRFGKWLEGARDWAISRNRYWGAPMPIWQNVDDEKDYFVVSSIAELEELAGKETVGKTLKKGGEIDLHRPFIDEITIKRGGKTYRRVEEVLDCWFESGSMPVAQWHYPFENKDMLDKSLPADFITESIDQTRLWFYVQHVIATILFNRPAFKQVVVTGFIMAADGQKLSKRLKNYPPVDEVFDHEGADALRLFLLSRTQGTETADYMRFDRSGVVDTQRNVLQTLYNSFKFFSTYSKLDGWQPTSKGAALQEPGSSNLLDQWILARIDETVLSSTKNADNYKIAHAILPIFTLIDDLSNWYIRRSRKRFWKSENDSDKQQACATLHYSLITICQLLAPWAPFLSDFIWRELRQGTQLPESVHLSDWPSVKEPDNTSHTVLVEMAKAREYIATGLALRAEAKIKVRQPLNQVSVPKISEGFEQIITEELNVKNVKITDKNSVELDTQITPELKSEGIARDLVREIQSARKKAGFNVEDRILLSISTDRPQISEALAQHKELIWGETLTTKELTDEPEHTEFAKVDNKEVQIGLKRLNPN